VALAGVAALEPPVHDRAVSREALAGGELEDRIAALPADIQTQRVRVSAA
jgi:uncharacterized small protein (DUF1192 family)